MSELTATHGVSATYKAKTASGSYYMSSNTITFQELIGWVPDAQAPNGEVRGASRLAGEASSREAATSTVVLEGNEGDGNV